MITVDVGQNHSGRLRKEGLGAEFTAIITDEKIDAKTEYEMGNKSTEKRGWFTMAPANNSPIGFSEIIPSPTVSNILPMIRCDR
jgi:hypothetical protein